MQSVICWWFQFSCGWWKWQRSQANDCYTTVIMLGDSTHKKDHTVDLILTHHIKPFESKISIIYGLPSDHYTVRCELDVGHTETTEYAVRPTLQSKDCWSGCFCVKMWFAHHCWKHLLIPLMSSKNNKTRFFVRFLTSMHQKNDYDHTHCILMRLKMMRIFVKQNSWRNIRLTENKKVWTQDQQTDIPTKLLWLQDALQGQGIVTFVEFFDLEKLISCK